MDRDTFKQLKESGGLVTDAALQAEPKQIVIEQEKAEPATDPLLDPVIEKEELAVQDEEDDLPALTEKEKTAFDKRLEREKAKFEEKRMKELEDQLELKYSKHKAAIDAIGGDPDKIIEAAKEAALKREADTIGAQNGWSEEDKQYFIEQKKQQQEIKELRIQRQIDKLKNDPDYAGIEGLEKEILAKIDKSGGQLTVDEAYWAIGGPKKAAQIKLEATMREAEKRKTTPRTVLTDNPAANTGEKPLPAVVIREADRMGISHAEARKLMASDSPQNIDEYRKSKAIK